ncbi:MAG: aminotransferase class I/II-fold pyridoxal phosphate-dependent enzyme [Candidatus Aminicenantes bacterium]|nr:MAG: aminotransferase class I/II-fold pyridoxal phosphate-dependent enzyme [Candidatus Aminicenantes bacterium]
MWFNRMELEIWFDKYQYAVDYDIGESAVKALSVKDIDIDLGKILLRYGYHTGRPDLKEALAEQYPGLSGDHIIVTTGASEANFIVVSALVKPGDHVVIEHPNYPSLYEVPRSLGCDVSLYTLKFENGFRPDLAELKKKITPQTKLVSLTHPNNPTGSMISEEVLHSVIELVESKDTYLLFDETYRHMASDEKLLPPAAALSPNVVSIASMSKCYGLPGIRTGWLATKSPFILDSAVAIREQLSISNNSLSEEIALSVLRRKDKFLADARTRIEFNRKIVADWMSKQNDFEWVYPEVGVVCFPRIKKYVNVDPEEVYRLLAEKYRTFVVPGRCFEMDERHFRIGFGADPGEIEIGLANLNIALNELAF